MAENDPQDDALMAKTPEALQRGFGRTFEALRYRDFRFLFIAQMSNSAAQWMQMIGLPILVLLVTGSGIHLGAVMVARTVPAMVLGPFSGVFADIFNRRTILLLTRVAGTTLAIWFAVINVAGVVTIVDIYIFALLRGATMSFDQAPRRALIPSMVPRHAIVNALALNTGGQQMMRVMAATFAGTIIAIWGTAAAFVALAALYVSGIPFLLAMRIVDHERSGYKGIRNIFSGAKDGLGFAFTTPVMRSALLLAAFFFVFGMSFSNVFAPLLAQRDLGLTEGGLGFLVAVMGFGGSAGTLVVAYISPGHHRGLILTIALSIYGVLLAAMAGSTYLATTIAAFVVIFFVGAGQSIFMPLLSTIVLQAAPDHMRGRAMSMLSWDRALVSAGSAVAGFAASVFGEQLALLGFGAACILGGLTLTAVGALRRVD